MHKANFQNFKMPNLKQHKCFILFSKIKKIQTNIKTNQQHGAQTFQYFQSFRFSDQEIHIFKDVPITFLALFEVVW